MGWNDDELCHHWEYLSTPAEMIVYFSNKYDLENIQAYLAHA